jgi:hypothetical protein
MKLLIQELRTQSETNNNLIILNDKNELNKIQKDISNESLSSVRINHTLSTQSETCFFKL